MRTPTELDSKIISSSYKDMKIVIKKPKFKKIRVAILYKNKDGTPKLRNNLPVVKETRVVSVLDGYEEETYDFPIKNLHNDSVTSTVLEWEEANVIRLVDDLIYELGMSMLMDPDLDFTKILYRLNGIKASMVDTAKSIGGRSVELAKTTITKGESRSYDYRSEKDYADYQERRTKNKGMLGLGLGPL